ncbi:MAG: bifunctional nuclease family protein [Thermoplasmatota archaeon]
MTRNLVKMDIHPEYYQADSYSEIVLVNDEVALPIYVTTGQAVSIINGLRGVAPSRPMTHDIFIKLINAMSGCITRVVIDGLHAGVFMAKLYIEHYGSGDAEEIIMDARPSDCIALAAREGCSIYVAADVLDEAGKRKEELGIE